MLGVIWTTTFSQADRQWQFAGSIHYMYRLQLFFSARTLQKPLAAGAALRSRLAISVIPADTSSE